MKTTAIIDHYRVELTSGGRPECTVIGTILKRELKASLQFLKATGRIEHEASGEYHEVERATIARIADWAAKNGF